MKRKITEPRSSHLLAFAVVATLFAVCVVLLFSTVGQAHGAEPKWRSVALNPNTAKACPSEDSGRMCVWDARHRGNGNGKSFVRGPKGGVHFISHRTAHYALFGANR